MKTANVEVGITKDQVMRALRAMTVHDDAFDPGPWSLWDAETLELAAALIRREVAAARRERTPR
jgi:hypothetical protein